MSNPPRWRARRSQRITNDYMVWLRRVIAGCFTAAAVGVAVSVISIMRYHHGATLWLIGSSIGGMLIGCGLANGIQAVFWYREERRKEIAHRQVMQGYLDRIDALHANFLKDVHHA
jgi:integral membrane sensor domain MASE1